MKAAVAGHPISHSLSPVLHRAAYARLGLDWTYEALDCPQGELAALLARLRADPQGWAGLSLTMPLKEAAVGLVDHLETDLGAVNTVLVAPGGQLRGLNTDVDGVASGLLELLGGVPAHAAVLGSGGTARAAVAALAAGGAQSVCLVARSAERAGALASIARVRGLEVQTRAWGPPPDGWPVIVTVPAGADDHLAPSGPVLDVRYHPWPTPYAAAAAAAGFPVVGGLSVLLAQAATQVRLMTGLVPPLEDMRRALAGATTQPGHSRGDRHWPMPPR